MKGKKFPSLLYRLVLGLSLPVQGTPLAVGSSPCKATVTRPCFLSAVTSSVNCEGPLASAEGAAVSNPRGWVQRFHVLLSVRQPKEEPSSLTLPTKKLPFDAGPLCGNQIEKEVIRPRPHPAVPRHGAEAPSLQQEEGSEGARGVSHPQRSFLCKG